jgi:hypothetical protein
MAATLELSPVREETVIQCELFLLASHSRPRGSWHKFIEGISL